MIAELDATTIDWSDFENAGKETRALLSRLAGDRMALRRLVDAVGDAPVMLAKCERHQLLDYLVIYDALDRGLRIRLHFSTQHHLDRPHDHRFPFSTLVLRGEYKHTWYHPQSSLYDNSADVESIEFIDKDHVDPRRSISSTELKPYLFRVQDAGSTYSLHHEAVHTTHTTPNTVSLFLRGPAAKSRSIIKSESDDRFWWRFGAENESQERRQAKQMSRDYYQELRKRLYDFNII